MKLAHQIATIAATALLLAACGAESNSNKTSNNIALAASTSDARKANNVSEGVSADAWKAGDAVDVPVDGNITEGGVYRVSGTLDHGITVAAPDDALVVLIFENADVSAAEGAAINVTSAKDVVFHLQGDSTVTGASSQQETDDINAAVHANADITIDGDGSLTVVSEHADGFTTTDDLNLNAGNLTVKAGADGLRGKDSVVVHGTNLTVEAGDDGIVSDQDQSDDRGVIDMSDGTVKVSAGGDAIQAATDVILAGGSATLTTTGDDKAHGIHAGTLGIIDGTAVTAKVTGDGVNSNGDVQLVSGSVRIDAADDGVIAARTASFSGATVNVDNSVEAVEATNVVIEQGDIELHSSDDGINASTDTGDTPSLTINDGNLTIHSATDGLDSNGTLTINGGTTTIYGPNIAANGAIDVDGTYAFNGGTLIAIGRSDMPRNPDSGQGWLEQQGNFAAGTEATVKSAEGSTLATVTPTEQATTLFVSTPELKDGETYSVVSGDTEVTATAGQSAGGFGGGPAGPGGQPPAGQPPMGEPPAQ